MASASMLSLDIIDGGFFILAATVMYCYDYVITFGEEVRCVWKRRISGASVLFLVNRYAMLAASLVGLVQVLPGAEDLGLGISDTPYIKYTYDGVCDIAINLMDAFLIVSNLAYTVFAALRMFALYGMRKSLFLVVLGMGLLNPFIQILLMTASVVSRLENPGRIGIYGPYGRINCTHGTAFNVFGIFGDETGFYNVLYCVAALRIHSLIFEIILIVLTWRKLDSRWTFKRPTFFAPFTTVMFRNGTLYFTIIALVSVLNILGMGTYLSVLKIPNPTPQSVMLATRLSSIGYIADAMTSICMSRFILDLLALTLDDQESQLEFSQWNTIRFATVIEATFADIGADLNASLGEGAEAAGEREAGRKAVEHTPRG